MNNTTCEIAVIGGGAAGLSAALVLGRSRRHTLVIDAGEPRNAPSPGAHNFLTRDGTPPAELLRIGREQLAPYDSVEVRHGRAISADTEADGFTIGLDDGTRIHARRLLLAVGVRDELPPIPGFAELWGRGVLHCPYCHGWEVRDEPLALYSAGAHAAEMAPLLLQLSRDLLLCAGGADVAPEDRERLEGLGVRIITTPVERLEGKNTLERIVFTDGHVEARHALFARPEQTIGSRDLVGQLGCELTDNGLIKVDAEHRTSVAGVRAIGDATTPMQQIVVAAAAGVTAAAGLNRELAQQGVVVGR